MESVLVILVFITSILFFYAVFQKFVNSDRSLEKRFQFYLDLQDKQKLDKKSFNLLVQLQLLKQKLSQPLNNNRNFKTQMLVMQSGINLKYEEYVIFRWITTGFTGALFYLLTGQMVFAIIGLIGGYIAPSIWLKNRYKKRLYAFNEGLSDMINTIVGSLRAGFSFTQALKTVAEESHSPIKEEVDQLLKEMQYGISMENALASLKERMPSEDLELMIHAILIQKQVGGNLATVLDKIVETIRERNRIQQQIITLTAQGRLSGMVIGLLPIILGFTIYLIESEYIGTLFNHPIGVTMLFIGIISGIFGFVMIRKLTRIEV
ncbi:type II secretion system F family protein [Desulfuribacillus alkaliarsenatis]|uniref:Type II secretion system protein n=1 Tax=Desulfuribacillus alkaliarsenatis TaxID=766136 RepID=A0A1E5G055_9FIRM|nr:type II secretion system F family protein [Desulfuribacillus alkaliarsenatis]OEF96194.1 type II secretion system protein [Desulfuribacillus alkaliarsenatis]